MTGLVLIGLVILWLVVAGFITRAVFRRLPERTWRPAISALLYLFLIPLPLVDEIVGGMQFERLCKEHSEIRVDRTRAAGKTVYLKEVPNVEISGKAVPITMQRWIFADVTNDDPILTFEILHATSGRLIRVLGISEGNVPFTFESTCAPGGKVDVVKLEAELGLRHIERKDREAHK